MRVDTLRPELRDKICEWIVSFYHLDPRYRILTFFNLVASEGADKLANDEDGDFVDDYDLDRTTSHMSTGRHHNLHAHERRFNSHSRAKSADFGSGNIFNKPNRSMERSKTAQAPLRPSATHLGLRESTVEMMSRFFDASSILTVWRPCSNDAMRKMMEGAGVGKGLDIKGKSAKRGVLSAFVPFMQIHDDAHKTSIQPIPSGSEMRIYYATEEARSQVVDFLQAYIDKEEAKISSPTAAANNNAAAAAINTGTSNGNVPVPSMSSPVSSSMWSKADLKMTTINKFTNKKWYGLQVSQRLFWFATINAKDVTIDRAVHHGGRTVTGRPSTPGFQDANNRTLRSATAQVPKPNPMPVVIQYNGILKQEREQQQNKQQQDETDYSPLDPLYLVMAYEEGGTVTPVVSDFDGFLLGWRREALWFGCNLPRDQEKLMIWCIDQIEQILKSPPSTDTWTCRWLDVLKEENASRSAQGGFHPDIPEYGFGDPKSYTIMEQAALRLKATGAVRHGSECFNYYFPQEIDDVFLLISDTLRPVPWRYVNVQELQSILSQKIAEGFVFPLNPKWILCDPGWYDLYQKLMASDALYADLSKDVWYPPFSGVRERIDDIKKKFPNGFQRLAGRVSRRGSVTVGRGFAAGEQAAADARRVHEELLVEFQNSASTMLADDYSPLRDNLHDAGFGDEGREESHLSGNAAADLAEIELENYRSVKHTLARQIYEAKLEDMNEEDEGDDELNCDPLVAGGERVTSSRRSVMSDVSGRSLGSAASSSSDGRTSLGDVNPTQGGSRRTMFKLQRNEQKANEGRYRTSLDDETRKSPPIMAAATTTTGTTCHSEDAVTVSEQIQADPRIIFAKHLIPSQPRRNFCEEFPPSEEFFPPTNCTDDSEDDDQR